MDRKLENIKKFRLFILEEISSLNSTQLNCIPEGFNNNIIWNIAHLVSTTQALCYKRSGLPVTIDDKYVTPFLPGTKPVDFIEAQEIEFLKKLMISTIDTLQADLEKKIFGNYTKSERIKEVYGIDVSTIDDALAFLLYHEGIHSGYILGLKRFVK